MDEARAGGTQPDAGAEQKNVPGSTAAVQYYCCTHCYQGIIGACSDLITGGQGHAMSTLLIASVKKVVDSRMTG